MLPGLTEEQNDFHPHIEDYFYQDYTANGTHGL